MAYGGTSEFRLLVSEPFGVAAQGGTSNLTTSQFGIGGGQMFVRFSTDMSTDFASVTGYFSGAGQPPYNFSAPFAGGGGSGAFGSIRKRPRDLAWHIPE